MDSRTDGQRQSDAVWDRLKSPLVRVVTTVQQGRVAPGSVFYVLPSHVTPDMQVRS